MTVDQMQIELMRRAAPQRLARRAIARMRPELDGEQRDVELVRVQYGAELAAKLERWLATRRRP